jgi:hypothetical protein
MRSAAFDNWSAKARAVKIEDEIARRGIGLRGKVERVGPCPTCGGIDRFSINTKKGVWNCRQCGVGGAVIKLVEHLDSVDFIGACTTLTGEPPPKATGRGNASKITPKKIVTATFEYHDESGNVVYVIERVEHQSLFARKTKAFRRRRPDPEHPGEWLWNVEGVPVVPYRLPQLIGAIAAGHPVLIAEGEGKADVFWSWNVAATCCAGGAKKWKPEHSEFLRGADVVLVPDNDDAGWQHVNIVGASLVGIAKRIRILILPGLQPKGDVIDWAKAGGTREQLDALLNDAQDWKPSSADETSEPNGDEKAKAKAREDELLAALAKATGLDYARQRKAAAEELDVAAKAIDDEVKTRRDAQVAPLYGHWITEPWPEPVDGDSLLRDIIRRFNRHMVWSQHDALGTALWLMLSWVHDDVCVHSPMLCITSAAIDSGKTTALGLVAFLAPRCLATADISDAALYRSITLWDPSFVIDEFDDVLANEKKRELRSILNTGHTRNQVIIRCVEPDYRPQPFKTFAPKAVGLVGRRMPPSTLSRCIFIELRRKKKDEKRDDFEHIDDAELADLRRRLRRWSMDNADVLRGAKPSMDQFDNRRRNNWKVQFAIADLSGLDWGEQAREAAVILEGASDVRSASVRALAASKTHLDQQLEKGEKAIGSDDLCQKMAADETSEWAEWGRSKKPITQPQLAALLKGFKIFPDRVRVGGIQKRGYERSWFEDAWARYL